jgi:hypothetical protein
MSDLGTFSIRVVDEEGRGVADAEVMCHYQSGGVGTEYTDRDGWTEWEILHGLMAGNYAIKKVWVNGTEVMDLFYPDDGDTFSVTVPSDC